MLDEFEVTVKVRRALVGGWLDAQRMGRKTYDMRGGDPSGQSSDEGEEGSEGHSHCDRMCEFKGVVVEKKDLV